MDICSFRPDAYLAAMVSGGMASKTMQSKISLYTAVHSEPVFVPSRLRDMAATATVRPCAASRDGYVKIWSISSCSPQ
jgi:hypothetical protein